MKNNYMLILLLIIPCCQNVYSQNSQTTQLNSNTSLLNDDNLHIYFCGTGIPNPVRQSVRKASCLAMIVNNDFTVSAFTVDHGPVYPALGYKIH